MSEKTTTIQLLLLWLLGFVSISSQLIDCQRHRAQTVRGQNSNQKMALSDNSNENATMLSPEELIVRSGFNYEHHRVISKDGYITWLLRIVNPLADRRHLKQPPVAIMHGGLTDPASWLSASSIQHEPEIWPRSAHEHEPWRSSNRSLGFMLANNGHDVWLVPTRGCNRQNQLHVRYKADGISATNRTLEQLRRSSFFDYWAFSFDEIIENEAPIQLDTILSLTGSPKVDLIVYSYSTIITLPLMSRAEFSSKVHNYVVISPILNDLSNPNSFTRRKESCNDFGQEQLLTHLFLNRMLTPKVRHNFHQLSKSKDMRYSLYKALINLGGRSDKFQTFIEGPLIGHILMPSGYRLAKHWCQQLSAGRLQKYDYGRKANRLRYGTSKPPPYPINKSQIRRWMLIRGDNDTLSTPTTVHQLLVTVPKRPELHLQVPGYSHVDVFAAFDNDIKINEPIEEFLNADLLSADNSLLTDQMQLNSIFPDKDSQSESEEISNSELRKRFQPMPRGTIILDGIKRRNGGTFNHNSFEDAIM